MANVPIYLCREDSYLPVKGSPGAAGYDIISAEDVVLTPLERKLVSTGIKIIIPPHLYGRIAPRSGLALKKGIDVGAGVIDSDYRGEVKVLLFNFGSEEVSLPKGSRIAQLIFEKIETPEVVSITNDEFMKYDTERKDGGFGSTGVRGCSMTHSPSQITSEHDMTNIKIPGSFDEDFLHKIM